MAAAGQARQLLRRPPFVCGPSGDSPDPLRHGRRDGQKVPCRPGVRGESPSRFKTTGGRMVRRRSAGRAGRRCPVSWRSRGVFPQGYIRTGATPQAGVSV